MYSSSIPTVSDGGASGFDAAIGAANASVALISAGDDKSLGKRIYSAQNPASLTTVTTAKKNFFERCYPLVQPCVTAAESKKRDRV
jgi:hypothetical protein